ncbi:tRNA (adenosine(37)-N6)-threonylcarbamoyltransferase complex dimerization subunit type 1 TsaB [Sulfuricystis multivorans]|uniref:tRNA (adenosine(37)-N6)-threonylcarbamoyltransferase complex dimerization subunit type 1 TsaB n=1 Tax=Sulfuricystis multivorans TaxID=2211108 RepID=UPI0015594848|nr:tRNA (adenosine(37)-N6)-threonylcarbamoyltransferase complex dimerization subunit type 1 TsaB [Sulfuricystis multivorans]
MKLIAFEAATRRLSVALWCDGSLCERSADYANGGSEVLLPWTLELLAEAGLTLRRLDGIAFGAGPGGFTGLRLACGVAQGLACGLDLPVAPVSSLAALALAAGDGPVLACLDARMNEVYLGAYRVAGDDVVERMAPKVGPGATAPLPEGDGFRGVGDGFATPHGEAIRARMGARLEAVAATVFPSAAAVARLGVRQLARGEGVPARQAQPLYVRDKVALTVAERRARGGEK